MKIKMKAVGVKLSPAEIKDIDRHTAKIEKRVLKYGPGVTLDLEIKRSSAHHRKGDVYEATATLIVAKKSMRGQADGESVSQAFEKCRKELEREVEKYKMSKEEKNYRDARKLKKMKQMTPLAWRGAGREEEQSDETEPLID